MGRGRKPKPIALRIREGNPGKRPLPKPRPAAKPGPDPTCPAHLGGDARREWRRIVPLLRTAGLLDSSYRAKLAAYCVQYGRWVDAELELRTKGPVTLSPSEYPIVNPWLSVANKAMALMAGLAADFGLSPVDAARLPTTGPVTGDSFEDFAKQSPGATHRSSSAQAF